ncbi:unnamed protein product [Amoebophrya sp. A120]|nr:unnamed protein product [Amoebophrya sp. A120]|eukprot:GSA120T00007724001.1
MGMREAESEGSQMHVDCNATRENESSMIAAAASPPTDELTSSKPLCEDALPLKRDDGSPALKSFSPPEQQMTQTRPGTETAEALLAHQPTKISSSCKDTNGVDRDASGNSNSPLQMNLVPGSACKGAASRPDHSTTKDGTNEAEDQDEEEDALPVKKAAKTTASGSTTGPTTTSTIFVYGTLQSVLVLEALLSRVPKRKPAVLVGQNFEGPFFVREQPYPGVVVTRSAESSCNGVSKTRGPVACGGQHFSSSTTSPRAGKSPPAVTQQKKQDSALKHFGAVLAAEPVHFPPGTPVSSPGGRSRGLNLNMDDNETTLSTSVVKKPASSSSSSLTNPAAENYNTCSYVYSNSTSSTPARPKCSGIAGAASTSTRAPEREPAAEQAPPADPVPYPSSRSWWYLPIGYGADSGSGSGVASSSIGKKKTGEGDGGDREASAGLGFVEENIDHSPSPSKHQTEQHPGGVAPPSSFSLAEQLQRFVGGCCTGRQKEFPHNLFSGEYYHKLHQDGRRRDMGGNAMQPRMNPMKRGNRGTSCKRGHKQAAGPAGSFLTQEDAEEIFEKILHAQAENGPGLYVFPDMKDCRVGGFRFSTDQDNVYTGNEGGASGSSVAAAGILSRNTNLAPDDDPFLVRDCAANDHVGENYGREHESDINTGVPDNHNSWWLGQQLQFVSEFFKFILARDNVESQQSTLGSTTNHDQLETAPAKERVLNLIPGFVMENLSEEELALLDYFEDEDEYERVALPIIASGAGCEDYSGDNSCSSSSGKGENTVSQNHEQDPSSCTTKFASMYAYREQRRANLELPESLNAKVDHEQDPMPEDGMSEKEASTRTAFSTKTSSSPVSKKVGRIVKEKWFAMRDFMEKKDVHEQYVDDCKYWRGQFFEEEKFFKNVHCPEEEAEASSQLDENEDELLKRTDTE